MGCPADLAAPLRRGEGAVAIGVDVSADAVTAVVTDGRGSVISSVERPVPRQCRADADRLAQEIGSAIQSLCAGLAGDLSTEASEAAALVVGVSVPGVVDEDEGRVRRSETLGLQDAPLVSLVRRSLSSQASGSPGLSGSLEVRLYQDAGCGAWAESQWGAVGRNCLYLAVGERISSAVLLGGAPVLGEGWAGQVGRILVPDPDWSGERARLEDVASVCAMVRRHTAGMLDDSAGHPAPAPPRRSRVAATTLPKSQSPSAPRVWSPSWARSPRGTGRRAASGTPAWTAWLSSSLRAWVCSAPSTSSSTPS